MRELAVAAMLVALAACTKSDDIRESVAVPKTASAPAPATGGNEGAPSDLPNSVDPSDNALGGGIKH
jgi:hypothetical protein